MRKFYYAEVKWVDKDEKRHLVLKASRTLKGARKLGEHIYRTTPGLYVQLQYWATKNIGTMRHKGNSKLAKNPPRQTPEKESKKCDG